MDVVPLVIIMREFPLKWEAAGNLVSLVAFIRIWYGTRNAQASSKVPV